MTQRARTAPEAAAPGEPRNSTGEPLAEAGRVRMLALVGMMAAVLAVLSWLSVPLPFSPVPVTMQTMGVLLAGTLLGPRLGALSVVVYLALGFVGLPVYHAGTSGPGVLFGPTGGFLLSFPLAAAVAGLGARWSAHGRGAVAAAGLLAGLLAAGALIYLVGIPWLAAVTGMGPGQAVVVGMLPYLAGDALKVAGALAVTRGVRRSLGASFVSLPARQ